MGKHHVPCPALQCLIATTVLQPLLNLNNGRSSQRVWHNGVRVGIGTGGLGERGQSQALCEADIEWERGGEGGQAVLVDDVADGDKDGPVLTAEVGDPVRGRDARVCRREFDCAVLGPGLAQDRERRVGWDPKLGDLWAAGAWDDKGLEERVRGVLEGDLCQERSGRGDLALQEAVRAVLLTLLADDRADDRDQVCDLDSLYGEVLLDVLQYTKREVGEGVGEGDGGLEVVDREVEFARVDGGRSSVGQEGVHSNGVKLLLLCERSVKVR